MRDDNDCLRNALYSHWCQQVYLLSIFLWLRLSDFYYFVNAHSHWHFISIYHPLPFSLWNSPWMGAGALAPFHRLFVLCTQHVGTRLTSSGWFSLSASQMDSILVHIVWNKFCPDCVTLWYSAEHDPCAFIRPFTHPKLKCIIDKHF